MRRRSSRFRRLALLGIAGVVAWTTACKRSAPAETLPTAGPILVFAVDGLEWDVVLPLLKAGRLPHLAGMMQRGIYGEIETFSPTRSPVIWTTVATGKVHERHGIHHFARTLPDGKAQLYNSTDRTTKALWNILSDHRRSVWSIGWWMTFPVEPVNGIMVAQTNTDAQLDIRGGKHVWKGTLIDGIPRQVHPPQRQDAIMAVLRQVEADLPALTTRIFGRFEHPPALLDQRLWRNCQWAFRADATYHRVALQLATGPTLPDLTLLYFGGPDVVGHRFWRYMRPEAFTHKPTPEQIANFGDVIEDYYAYTDEALGQLLEAFGPGATTIVVSDHGMHAINPDGHFDPDDPPRRVNSGEHQDAPPGVFFAAGPAIRRNSDPRPVAELTRKDLVRVCNVLDLTPTLLAMLRIPIGEDMDGRVARNLFRENFKIDRQPPRVTTHDTAEFLAARRQPAARQPGEAQRLKQLRSLGYIGGDDSGTGNEAP